MARKTALRTFDALYLACLMERRAEMVTGDRLLAKSAEVLGIRYRVLVSLIRDLPTAVVAECGDAGTKLWSYMKLKPDGLILFEFQVEQTGIGYSFTLTVFMCRGRIAQRSGRFCL